MAYTGLSLGLAGSLCIAAPLHVVAAGWTHLAFAIVTTNVGILSLAVTLVTANVFFVMTTKRTLTPKRYIIRLNIALLMLLCGMPFVAYIWTCFRGGS
jgi:hypothetical protein